MTNEKDPGWGSISKLTKEAEWKQVNRPQWEENKTHISSIKACSLTLKSKHGFDHTFDLADHLIGVRKKYLQDRGRSTTKEQIDQHKQNIGEAFTTGSLTGLTEFDQLMLICFGGLESTTEPTDRQGANKLRRSIRMLRRYDRNVVLKNNERKAGGRYEDFATATVVRSLVVVLYRATGELPKSGKASVLGPYTAFVRDACGVLQIKISDRAFKYHLGKIIKPLRETEKPVLERMAKE